MSDELLYADLQAKQKVNQCSNLLFNNKCGFHWDVDYDVHVVVAASSTDAPNWQLAENRQNMYKLKLCI